MKIFESRHLIRINAVINSVYFGFALLILRYWLCSFSQVMHSKDVLKSCVLILLQSVKSCLRIWSSHISVLYEEKKVDQKVSERVKISQVKAKCEMNSITTCKNSDT